MMKKRNIVVYISGLSDSSPLYKNYRVEEAAAANEAGAAGVNNYVFEPTLKLTLKLL
jgi:hypothetical protein